MVVPGKIHVSFIKLCLDESSYHGEGMEFMLSPRSVINHRPLSIQHLQPLLSPPIMDMKQHTTEVSVAMVMGLEGTEEVGQMMVTEEMVAVNDDYNRIMTD